MNIENLYEGQVIKNYKELCKLIEETPVTSNSKRAQLKNLERYVSYHKEGQKIIIDEIYETVQPKEDKRCNGMYIDDIKAILIDLLLKTPGYRLLISPGKLLNITNMTNDNYIEGRNNIDRLSELIDVSKEACYDFYNYTQSDFKNKLESALKSLQKDSLINYQKCYIIVKIVAETNKLGETKILNGKVNSYENHRIANEEERRLILTCEQEALCKLGCKNKQQVYISGQWKTFRKIITNKLKDYGNIRYYYEGYSLVFNREYVEDYVNRYDLIDIVKERLNDNIKLMIKTRAENKKEKIEAKFFIPLGGQPDNKNKIYVDKNYLVSMEVLIDTVIDDEAENIKEKFKEGYKNNIIEEKDNEDMPF